VAEAVFFGGRGRLRQCQLVAALDTLGTEKQLFVTAAFTCDRISTGTVMFNGSLHKVCFGQASENMRKLLIQRLFCGKTVKLFRFVVLIEFRV
jgi:hypothetical protein